MNNRVGANGLPYKGKQQECSNCQCTKEEEKQEVVQIREIKHETKRKKKTKDAFKEEQASKYEDLLIEDN